MPYRKIIKPFVRKTNLNLNNCYVRKDNITKAKATHSINQFISSKRLRVPFSSPRNPTFLYSSNSKASTSIIHSLNFQGIKKNFQRLQLTTR